MLELETLPGDAPSLGKPDVFLGKTDVFLGTGKQLVRG